jgi:hypothetical protein
VTHATACVTVGRMKQLLRYLMLLSIVLFAGAVFAQASLPVVVPESPVTFVDWVRKAFASGEYALAVGGILTVLVRIGTATKTLQEKLPADSRKWIAMALAMFAAVSTALLVGAGWATAIVNGLLAGFTSVGGWEVIGKKAAPVEPTGQAKA